MLELFHAPQSRSSRILWLLEELGADAVKVRYVNITRRDGSGGRDPANPHPDGKVPALLHDGALVLETTAIIQHLCDLHPEAGLLPPVGTPQRGAALGWLAYYGAVLEPVLIAQFMGLGDDPMIARTYRDLGAVHARIEAALADAPYLSGETFGAADLLYASLGTWMRDALPQSDTVQDWLDRCLARPACVAGAARDAEPVA
ncbi:glutathione S-transferase family protein [Pontivivens ytuae]|uniref:Glutathione S-transferase family protein n=1 Tax=Pontivivens ytuae TaxID=2789856 RepID=A0A7S9LP11_9RHOB|nr:glutathione S-transferase family protein [Pontivivens ytuae]QPH52639.1 glutathione S-transferase family protein [Pontivivens ytuae]